MALPPEWMIGDGIMIVKITTGVTMAIAAAATTGIEAIMGEDGIEKWKSFCAKTTLCRASGAISAWPVL